MNGAISFFVNAMKAIIFSPFYVAVFLLNLVYSFINHLIGEVRVLFSGFRYGTKTENKYTRELANKIRAKQNGGDKS